MAWLAHLLVCTFGLAAWLAVNGVWVELPIVVNVLPEGWELPSYLNAIVQFGNLGPLVVTLMHKFRPGLLDERLVIYAILSVGVASCVLLAVFWDETMVVGGAQRSIAFFAIMFFLALANCTSSVTFLPFMARLPAKCITTYFIGEGLGGLLPGIVALMQGVGRAKCVNATAVNQTDANTNLQVMYLPPNFSTEVYFFLLAAMTCASLAAFFALNRLPRSYTSTENLMPAIASVDSGLDDQTGRDAPRFKATRLKAREFAFIYLMLLWVNGIVNGAMPPVQSYSSSPYGNLVYHLCAALTAMANPAACTVATFFQTRSLLILGGLTVLGTGFGSYNMAMAVLSPCPLLQGTVAGQVIIVVSWVLLTGTLIYVKTMLGVILRDHSQSALLWSGVSAQVGSMVASIIMFPLISVYKLFKSGDFCNTSCALQ